MLQKLILTFEGLIQLFNWLKKDREYNTIGKIITHSMNKKHLLSIVETWMFFMQFFSSCNFVVKIDIVYDIFSLIRNGKVLINLKSPKLNYKQLLCVLNFSRHCRWFSRPLRNGIAVNLHSLQFHLISHGFNFVKMLTINNPNLINKKGEWKDW